MNGLTGSAADALPRITHEERSGVYLRVYVETEPVLTDQQKDALIEWAEECLPLSKAWEWHDAINAEQTEWEFVFEYDPLDYYEG